MQFPGLHLVLLGTAALAAQQSSEISGDYLEGRSNHVFGCYCEWSAEAAMGGTEAIVAWDFQSGEYRGVPLAGVRVAAVIVSERTLSMGHEPRKSVLFLDSAASTPRREAVEALLRRQFADLLGEIAGVRLIPIRFEREPGRVTLRAGQLMNLSMRKARLPDDALQGAVLWYGPFIPLDDATLATTLNHSFRGREFDNVWDRSDIGTTGYYGRFRIVPR